MHERRARTTARDVWFVAAGAIGCATRDGGCVRHRALVAPTFPRCPADREGGR